VNEHGVAASDGGVLAELAAKAYDACVPLHASLELTTRCSLRCVHCYNFDRDEARPASAPPSELGFEAIRVLLAELKGEGTLFLSLTGGEALLHPRFWDVFAEAGRLGFATALLTHGALLDEETCRRLAGAPQLWGVGVSFYGATAATHDATTRRAGSWAASAAGVRRLAALGAAVSVKFILMKGNAGEAEAMVAWAEREGWPWTADPALTARYDGTTGSLAERVDVEQLAALYRGPLAGMLGKGPSEPTDDEFRCNCARGNVAISSTGEVWPCIAAPWSAGRLREGGGFGRIWRESPVFRRIRGLRVADFPTCAPCALKAWCRRSPGVAYLATGDYTSADPWTCREAALRSSL
jgi:radical SAM protein with 4Fe4S-binding SPASM domain